MSEIYDLCSRSEWSKAERLFDSDPHGGITFRDRQGWSILHEACNRNAPVEFVRKLLMHGLDPNERNLAQRTPLIYALQKQSFLDLVHLLLSVGANPNVSDKLGKTPMHWAVLESVPVRMLEMAVEAGGDLNRPDDEGKTPMHTALELPASPDMLQTLLDLGGDPNVADDEGAPLLYTAVFVKAKPSAIRVLLMNGATIDTMRLRVAKKHGNPILCAQIEKALIFIALCAAGLIRRIGRRSYVRVLPDELLKILAGMVYPDFGDHLMPPPPAQEDDVEGEVD